MSRSMKLAAAMLGAAMLVGCESREDTPATPPTTPAPAPTADAGTATDPASQVTDAAKTAASDTATAAKDAAGAAADTAAKAADEIKAGVPAVPPPAGTAAPSTQPAAAGDAQKLVDQAMQYIKDNKLDLADKTVTQLEGMKASLSPSLQTSVDNARKALTAAKASGLLTQPGAAK